MLCKKCGNELKMGAKFCYSCGYYVDEDEDYEDEEEDGSNKKKKKKKDGEPKLSFKERWAKRKEEKQLAKEAKIRQKEIEAEEKEREKMAAEYEKEQKIKEFYKKEQEDKLRAERRAKAQEEKERARELERQRQIDENFNQKKSQFDEELNKNMKSNNHRMDADDDNANFSYGTESLINRSPGLGVEESAAPVHNKDDAELSFDDFNVENRYKKIAGEVKKTNASKNTSLDLSYDDYKNTNTKKKKNGKSELSKYGVVIISSIISFVVIFGLVYFITNSMSSKEPEPTTPVVVEDITVLLGNCTISIPGNLNYNVEGNNLYVAYDNFTLSFTISKDKYESYASDLTKLSKDFEKRNYTVSSSDKRDINGKEYIIYKIIVNGSSKYFYLTQVKSSYVAMGMIEMTGNASVDESLQAISNIIFSVKM